jgi:hypothetical protein
MEDISSLIWLGIAVVWLLTRIIRGGVKKAARAQQRGTQRRPPTATAPGGPTAPTERQENRFGQPTATSQDGAPPPPIVPR